jgi:pyruvate dehydrogenase E2 component (dihydrolipoamide acetyltransferase)
MKLFKLPDLGEGLQEVEIVQWYVEDGASIKVDQPLVSVETAKAIVDIPSPFTATVSRRYGKAGEFVQVGDPLVEFAEDQDVPVKAVEKKKDPGTVVGEMLETEEELEDEPVRLAHPIGHAMGAAVHATPAVRALAHHMKVDLTLVSPTGPKGVVTVGDVQKAAKQLEEHGPMEPLRGVRRAMAQTMARAHAEVVPVTLNDDADIHAWDEVEDISIRLIRALIAGCKAEPGLNAWYDGKAMARRLMDKVDVGIAVDTPDGLFVPVLRDVANRSDKSLRKGLNQLKDAVKKRKIPPEELRDYSITISNFGVFAGKYANPIVVPPAVAILGAGKVFDAVVAVKGKAKVHRTIPLSLTFDHRAVTGGEAARFLKVVLEDLTEKKG